MARNPASSYNLARSNVDELQAIADQFGRRIAYRLDIAPSPHGYVSFTAVALVDGVSYSSTHQNEIEALEAAAGYALRELRQQLVLGTSTPSIYHLHTPGYPTTSPAYYTDHEPIPHHMVTQPYEHYRMELNNMAAARGLGHVTYEHGDPTGSQHDPCWTSTVYVGGMKCGQGYGNSKRAASEQAAKQALEYLIGLNYETAQRPRQR